MKVNSEEHLIYKLMNTPIYDYPYPHFHATSVFDDITYNDILTNIPDDENYMALNETLRTGATTSDPSKPTKKLDSYKDRFIIEMETASLIKLPEHKRDFWIQFSEWFLGEYFLNSLLIKFKPYIEKRLMGYQGNKKVRATGLITRDKTGYSIGPHTDAPRKLLTLLFYLPSNNDLRHLGTSIYKPKGDKFICEGGPHYKFDRFDKVITAPFIPNSLFCFFKTNDSFHGVDLIIDENIERDLLIYNVNILDT